MNTSLAKGIGYAESDDNLVEAGQSLTLDVQFVGTPGDEAQVRVIARAPDSPFFDPVTVLNRFQSSLTLDAANEPTVYRIARTEEAVELSVTGEVKAREYSGEFTLERHQLPARFCVAGLGDIDDLSLFAVEAGELEEMLYAKATDIVRVIEINTPGAYRWRSLAPVRTYLTTS